jgi:hypothetical protein
VKSETSRVVDQVCKELVATLIPDRWHAHARPDGGLFDPESDL